jgi:hypothetical protein
MFEIILQVAFWGFVAGVGIAALALPVFLLGCLFVWLTEDRP